MFLTVLYLCPVSRLCCDVMCVCFVGRHCEIYKDPCAKLQCQNGGQCERRRSNATCVCAPGYTGEYAHESVSVGVCERARDRERESYHFFYFFLR